MCRCPYHDQDWLDLKQRLSFTDEFVEQHKEPITNFLLHGGSAMAHSLYGYLQGNDKAIEALRRIVQAELMGQFYTLKYFTDDLQREIRYPISEAQETAWKHNLTLERGRSSQKKQMIFTVRCGWESCPIAPASPAGLEASGNACWRLLTPTRR